jgi:hypothetical protein
MTDVNENTENTKRYEDYSDDDVAAVLNAREEHRKSAKTEVPAGLYFSKVKVQMDAKFQPGKGIFAGAQHITLGLAPFANPEDDGSALKNGIVWASFALPVANPGQKMSADARSIAISNLQALGLAPTTGDELADIKAALEVGKAISAGTTSMVGAKAYTDVSYSTYTSGGKERSDTNVRYYKTLSKNRSLTPISE